MQSWERRMELEESTFLTSDYTTKLQYQDSMVLAKTQNYRPMEQDRKTRNKSMHLWAPYFWWRRQEYEFNSVAKSCSTLRPHESQHARPPCPSPTPRVYSDSLTSSQWCHTAISSSVVPCSSSPQSLPAAKSFPMSQLFQWGGQSTGVSPLTSFRPKKSQGWSPSEWTAWISLQSKGLSRVLSKHQFFGAQPSSQSNSHIHTCEKPQEKP